MESKVQDTIKLIIQMLPHSAQLEGDFCGGANDRCPKCLLQALLTNPENTPADELCKTCEGSGKKDNKIIYGNKVSRYDGEQLSEPEDNTCPDCPPEPEIVSQL